MTDEFGRNFPQVWRILLVAQNARACVGVQVEKDSEPKASECPGNLQRLPKPPAFERRIVPVLCWYYDDAWRVLY